MTKVVEISEKVFKKIEDKIHDTRAEHLLKEQLQQNISKVQNRFKKAISLYQNKQELKQAYTARQQQLRMHLDASMERVARQQAKLHQVTNRSKDKDQYQLKQHKEESVHEQPILKEIQKMSPKQYRSPITYEQYNRKQEQDRIYEMKTGEFFKKLNNSIEEAEERRAKRLKQIQNDLGHRIDEKLLIHKNRYQQLENEEQEQRQHQLINKLNILTSRQQQKRQIQSEESKARQLRLTQKRQSMTQNQILMQKTQVKEEWVPHQMRQYHSSRSHRVDQDALLKHQEERERRMQEILEKHRKIRAYNLIQEELHDSVQEKTLYFNYQLKKALKS